MKRLRSIRENELETNQRADGRPLSEWRGEDARPSRIETGNEIRRAINAPRVAMNLAATENGRRVSRVGRGDPFVINRTPGEPVPIRRRWLAEDKRTLQDLADEYGVSAERIRQIEAMAISKLRTAMTG